MMSGARGASQSRPRGDVTSVGFAGAGLLPHAHVDVPTTERRPACLLERDTGAKCSYNMAFDAQECLIDHKPPSGRRH